MLIEITVWNVNTKGNGIVKCDLLKAIIDGAPDKACISRDPSTIILYLPVSSITEPNKSKKSVLHIDKSVQILII